MKIKMVLIALTVLFLFLLIVPSLYTIFQSGCPLHTTPITPSDSDKVEERETFFVDERCVPLIYQNPELPNGC